MSQPQDDDATRRIPTSESGPQHPGYTPESGPQHPGYGYGQPPTPPPGYPPSGQQQGPGYPPPSGPQGPAYGQQGPPPGYQQGPPPGYQQQPPYGYSAPQPRPPHTPGVYGPRPGSDDTTMAMLSHLLGLLVSWIGPLVIYLIKRDESPYVRDQSAEALNFQITMFIAYMVCFVLAFVLIGFFLLPVVWLISLIFHIQAAIAANKGENYRYPMSIRLVS